MKLVIGLKTPAEVSCSGSRTGRCLTFGPKKPPSGRPKLEKALLEDGWAEPKNEFDCVCV